jgi:predicted nucleic acid-binding protein
VPEEVYVDTGVLIAATFPGTTYSRSCRQFCDDLAGADSMVYTAQMARLDLARALRRMATKPGRLPLEIHDSFKLEQWASNPLIRSRWLWYGIREFERLIEQFARFTEVPFSMSVWKFSLDLMAAEALDSSDAMHLATARTISLPDFATTDADFRRIASPRVHLIRDTLPG